MRATLHFNLDNPEERLEHKRALNATKVYIALHTIFQEVFRKRLKYGNLDFDSENLLTEVRNECSAILEEYDINLNDLE